MAVPMGVNETPPFWFEKPGLKAWLLSPAAWLYSRVAAYKMTARPSGAVPVPVLCIGNFIAGGGGKTPTALCFGAALAARGYTPGFLSRGYGGRIHGPARVALDRHNARDVGDEPLLLARRAPTVVSADRLAGARLLVDQGCDFIVMDDGFQNPQLEKDFTLVAVDSRRGIGNGFAMPAGPLRLAIAEQLRRTDAVLVIGGEAAAGDVVRRAARIARPVYEGELVTRDRERLKSRWLVAYAGIADPQKFFASLEGAGAELAMTRGFGDHHYFSEEDANELIDHARLLDAELVTTTKDYVRLAGMGSAQAELAAASKVIEADLVFEDARVPDLVIDRALKRFEARRLRGDN